MILKDDNGEELPKNIQDKVNNFIDNIPNINWFNPSPDLKKSDVDKQVKLTLKCFGLEANIEYRKLDKQEDWDSARASAWASAWISAWASARVSARASARDSAWVSARVSARDSARVSARDSARVSARDSARVSARDSAWASIEILVEDNKDFKSKYPNGAFKQLFKLWEMGLYPVGILDENKKFVVYAKPIAKDLFEDNKTIESLPNELNINGTIYVKQI